MTTFNKLQDAEISVVVTEIVDNACDIVEAEQYSEYFEGIDDLELINPSEISVLVTVNLGDEKITLDYQTTETMDGGAYSDDLEPYTDTPDYEKLKKFCSVLNNAEDQELVVNEELLTSLIGWIKKEAEVNEKRRKYVNENYIVSEDRSNFMDGDSLHNLAARR